MMHDTRNAKASYALIRLLRPLYKQLEKAVQERLKPYGHSVIDRAVLEALHPDHSKTVPQIAHELMVERQFIQRTVNELRSEGWVRRLTNPHHKRSFLFQLTPSGRDRIEEILQAEHTVLAEIMGDIPLDDIHTARTVLQHLATSFTQLNKEASHD
ncbi:MarR family winged helix-turn-helix transcriptional regulator [Terasakiella pusilla]|uniref:MarR family winged helix-turn-helix transcriptional regulator n=1 Tax=Terasakiella pusilla TaxID=64973 RepID=UPI00068AA5B7|nr:MarR family transcriptional regulator [Terasakiella pusilla]